LRVPEISKDASAASTCYDSGKFSPDSPALAGRGRIVLTIRVRGTLRESESVERAPHPDPLPVKNGERE
jgi:hypothetical protein